MGLPAPAHPLISVINFEAIKRLPADQATSLVHDFYSIALKRNFNARFKYGQQDYKFDEGIMVFLAPGQVFSIEIPEHVTHSGWLLFIHPDYVWNTPLAKTIRQYDYFSYSVHEALHLSEKEEATVIGLMQNMAQECRATSDKFSQHVLIAQLELLLDVCRPVLSSPVRCPRKHQPSASEPVGGDSYRVL